jgi:hypothetical protein
VDEFNHMNNINYKITLVGYSATTATALFSFIVSFWESTQTKKKQNKESTQVPHQPQPSSTRIGVLLT